MAFNPSEYWNERLKKNFNLVGVGDISMGVAYNKLSYAITRIGLCRIFNKYCKNKNGQVLDIGSGIGFIVSTWQNAGYNNIDGSDISNYAVDQLKLNFPQHNFYELDISDTAMPTKRNSYDYVTCASVLYHIVDDEKWKLAFSNIRSMMKQGGVFIFSEGFSVADFNSPHQVTRSREKYVQTLKDAGFELLKSSPNYILMSDPTGTRNKLFKYWWYFATTISRRFPNLAFLLWGGVYPIELILTKVMSKTPGQEFWVCRAV